MNSAGSSKTTLDQIRKEAGHARAGADLQSLATLALAARREAKRVRDLGEPLLLSEAVECLREVLDALEAKLSSLNASSDTLVKCDLHSHIADTYGVMGGIHRVAGRFDQAASAYHDGLTSEREVQRLGGPPSSYCLVQEIVNLILAKPEALEADRSMRDKLASVGEEMKEQVRLRPRDPWAQADLALVTLLSDPEESFDEWDAFDDLRPPSFAYESTSDVVASLFERLSPFLSTKESACWDEIIANLKAKSGRA